MTTAIYYFSGTGNCLRVAEDLAGELGGAEVISIPHAVKNGLFSTEADCVGLVYPVYMWGIPLIVADFIRKIKIENNAFIFAIATFGGMPGATLLQNQKILALRGLKLSLGFAVRMPGNYTPLYGAIPQEKQEKMFEKEKQRVKEIALAIKEKRVGRIETSNFLVNLLSGAIYKLGSSKIRAMDSGFWVNEKCNGCAVCFRVCPVGNIAMQNSKPVWKHHCEQCLACLQWCPEEALQYGKSTSGRRRYHHPQVKLDEIIQK
ncbi:MAG: 4Fe-4S ferredoxin [Candidatus Omnitrophica bacterium]|nr:4Fe-4S ferredoxin [Candidatus Omnitrophota bacterium]